MTENSTKRKAFLTILAIISVAAIALRSAALLLNFDEKSGYFEEKFLITIANALVIGGAILFFAVFFAVKKDTKLIATFATPATYIPTGLLALGILFLSVNVIADANITAFKSLSSFLKNTTAVISSLLFVFGILAIFHFILTAVITRRNSVERAALGLCAVGFFGFYAIFLYFSKALPLNAPNKLVDEMAYLFSALFFLYEIRISLGREKWRSYLVFGLIASLITGYSAIPAFIYYLAKGTVITLSVYELALTLVLFIFITSRLVLAFNLKADCESLFVTKLREKFAEALCKSSATREERFAYIESAESEPTDEIDADEEDMPELEVEVLTEAEDSEAELEIEVIIENSAEESDEASDDISEESPGDESEDASDDISEESPAEESEDASDEEEIPENQDGSSDSE